MRGLGIDFGERRIGLALSDPAGRLALPSRTLERRSDAAVLDELAGIAREESIGWIAMGEPLRPADGAPTERSRRVRAFAAKLGARTGLPIVFVDEALTSTEAEARLAEAGVPPARRAERRDAVAAQIVLEEALERRRRAVAAEGR